MAARSKAASRFRTATPSSGSKITAELKAERLDLDAATAFARSLAGPQAEWPDEGHLSLDIGRAISAGQELRPLVARLGYGPKAFSLDQLNIGQPDKVALEGTGRFDRVARSGSWSSVRRRRRWPAHRADCTVCAIAGRAARCDGHEPGPRARRNSRSISTRTPDRPIAPMRAP